MRTAPAAAVNRPLIIRAAIAFAAATLVCSAPASADPVTDFYRGKTLRMLIGYGPGGGYDIYGRLVAEFLPRHLPGNPTIVAQNMPGAGSFVAAKYIYEVAPRKVKQAIVGYGAAQKLAVAKMVQRMLHLTELPSPDAADALALALTHAQENGRYTLTTPKRI